MSQKKPFSAKKIFIYFGIIFFIGYFFTKNTLDFSQLRNLSLTTTMIQGIVLAFAMLLIRDLGYVLRLRLMTEYQIKFWPTVKIILLWEFGSAITPGMIGGKAVAIYLLIKNKIHAARASSIVLLAILLDEFIFIILFPIFYFTYGKKMFQFGSNCPDWISLKAKLPWIENIKYLESTIFIMLGFIVIFVITAFIGIFIYPGWIKNFIRTIARFPLLKKWRNSISEFADEIYQTSVHIRTKKFKFWFQLCIFTLLSWLGRYLVGVAIVYGFSNGNIDWAYVYVKQYALWLMFYLPSTPGASGIAEAIYMAFYCDSILPNMSGTAAFVWRIMSYYIYLLIGLMILTFSREKEIVEQNLD